MPDRILVTGACGFIGSALVRHLLVQGYTVTTLDRLDDAGRLDRLAALKREHGNRLECLWHDLRAPIPPSYVPTGEYRYIAHLAAGSHVDRSIRDPLTFVADNVLGTANVLEYARRYQPDAKLLYFSTDEVFGSAPAGVAHDEHARFEPRNPYAGTKAAGECLAVSWALQWGMPIVVSHCSNAYGPGQDAEKFIPMTIANVRAGRVVQVHTVGGVVTSRLYIHVDDVARAILTVLEKGGTLQDATSGRYNICADEELSNYDVACRIASRTGSQARIELVENPAGRPKPDLRYSLTDAKLRALGWAPRIGSDDGLAGLLNELSGA